MFSRLLACAIPSETGWQKVGVGSWSLLAVWSGIPQWLEWSSERREEKRRCTHEYMWKTLCDNITYWRQNYILLKIEWFEDCNGRHMDGCGERPCMGKFDLVVFTCARADRIIIASTNTHKYIGKHKYRCSITPGSLLCEIRHGINIRTHTEDTQL